MRLTYRALNQNGGHTGEVFYNAMSIKTGDNIFPQTDKEKMALKKLATYEDADEQGLLVRLPQKTVYVIGWGEGKDCDHICPAKIDGVGCCSLCDNGELIIYEEECHQEHLPHIGKNVFLTREEAEAALKGVQSNE